MALKPDRVVIETDITKTCPTATPRGVCLVLSAAGSGVNIGDNAGTADLLTPSGKVPAGILMNDVVSTDLTRYHLNFHKDEVPVNSRVTLLRKGRVTTDALNGSPNPGDTAYLTTNGQLTPTVSATGGTAATPKVGQFAGKKDENGFVAVDINLPVV